MWCDEDVVELAVKDLEVTCQGQNTCAMHTCSAIAWLPKSTKTHGNNTKHECDNNTTRHRYIRTRNTHAHRHKRHRTKCLCILVCVSLSVCLSVCPSVYPSASPSVSPSVSLCADTDRHRHRQTLTRNEAQNYSCTDRLVHKMFASRCVTSKTLILHIGNAETRNIACFGICVWRRTTGAIFLLCTRS